MPSRRELTAHYDVTAPVIDRAMQILRVKGITETLAGVGVYVREGQAVGNGELLARFEASEQESTQRSAEAVVAFLERV